MADKREIKPEDMIGVRNERYPLVTMAGRNYRRPVVKIRLDDKHFCIKDNSLSHDEQLARIEELKAVLSKSTPKVTKAKDES